MKKATLTSPTASSTPNRECGRGQPAEASLTAATDTLVQTDSNGMSAAVRLEPSHPRQTLEVSASVTCCPNAEPAWSVARKPRWPSA
jgi:hypothetical protein